MVGKCIMIQDEETGSWYQHKGTDFKVPLTNISNDDGNTVETKQDFAIWPGCETFLFNANIDLKADLFSHFLLFPHLLLLF